jgi:hypothetical protein
MGFTRLELVLQQTVRTLQRPHVVEGLQLPLVHCRRRVQSYLLLNLRLPSASPHLGLLPRKLLRCASRTPFLRQHRERTWRKFLQSPLLHRCSMWLFNSSFFLVCLLAVFQYSRGKRYYSNIAYDNGSYTLQSIHLSSVQLCVGS